MVEKYIRVRTQPEELLTHLAWMEALPGVEVSVQKQPDEPEVTVLHVVAPMDQMQDNDVEIIMNRWEEEHPGTVLRDWLKDKET